MRISVSASEKINRKILLVSEDRLKGFHRDPIEEISKRTNLESEVVIQRLRAMMKAGVIRRVRQTIMAIQLVPGALVAWKIPEKNLLKAFKFMSQKDPFSGHVVIRRAEYSEKASEYRLWTTLKVPLPFSIQKHCEWLQQKVGAEKFFLMPAKGIFALSVGHSRRKNMKVGAKLKKEISMQKVKKISLNRLEWKILKILKREFSLEEIQPDLWRPRVKKAGLNFEKFCKIAKNLEHKGILGRFSTFLEHANKISDEKPIASCHALLQWAVPRGKEEKAGVLIANYDAVTHCYWRKTSREFGNVNIMAMIHGDHCKKILRQKAVMDHALAKQKIFMTHTNIFWSEKSEIKPSEIDADVYKNWQKSMRRK